MEEQSKPRHEQIAHHLRREIKEDYFQEGDKLPFRKKGFVNISKWSRITVRRALQTLENENLIYRKQGLGAFCDGSENRKPTNLLTDFAEDLKERAIKHRQKLFVASAQSSLLLKKTKC